VVRDLLQSQELLLHLLVLQRLQQYIDRDPKEVLLPQPDAAQHLEGMPRYIHQDSPTIVSA
jgi:hypothetical protein